MENKLVSNTEGTELKEKVKHLEAVIQNMFQNVIRLNAKICKLKRKTKIKDITEKTSVELESTDTVNSSEEKCQSKQEIIVKKVDTIKKVIISKPSTIEIIKDKAEQHDDFKCDVCEYMT